MFLCRFWQVPTWSSRYQRYLADLWTLLSMLTRPRCTIPICSVLSGPRPTICFASHHHRTFWTVVPSDIPKPCKELWLLLVLVSRPIGPTEIVLGTTTVYLRDRCFAVVCWWWRWWVDSTNSNIAERTGCSWRYRLLFKQIRAGLVLVRPSLSRAWRFGFGLQVAGSKLQSCLIELRPSTTIGCRFQTSLWRDSIRGWSRNWSPLSLGI